MMKLTVREKVYKIKFGFNCFCDTDLMDRVNELVKMFQDNGVKDDNDVNEIGQLKDLFLTVRELLYVGFAKYNPVETVQEVGEILDDWEDEGEENGEDRGLTEIFTDLTTELFNMGFLASLVNQSQEPMQNGVKAPADHKRK